MADLTITREEREHKERIAENYRKIFESATPAAERERTAPAYPKFAPAAPSRETSVPQTNNAARIADYTAHPAPAGKKVLFEDVTYQGQELILRAPVAAPARAEAAAPAVEELPVSEEDALPTRRTMAMFNRNAAAEEQQVGFFAALSARTKVALAALTACILVFLTLIIVNAAILSTLGSQISAEETEIARLEERSGEITGDIDYLLDPDTIAEWAQGRGMHQ